MLEHISTNLGLGEEVKTDRNDSFQTRKEREIQQQMLAQDEETVELRETFTSLQQEVEAKTKKLKKVKAAQNPQMPPTRNRCALSASSFTPSTPDVDLMTP